MVLALVGVILSAFSGQPLCPLLRAGQAGVGELGPSLSLANIELWYGTSCLQGQGPISVAHGGQHLWVLPPSAPATSHVDRTRCLYARGLVGQSVECLCCALRGWSPGSLQGDLCVCVGHLTGQNAALQGTLQSELSIHNPSHLPQSTFRLLR